MVKKIWVLSLVVLLLVALAVFLYFEFPVKEGDFSRTSLVRLNIPEEGSFETSIKVTNYDSYPQTLRFSLADLSGVAGLSGSEFYLESGESRELEIIFEDDGRGSGVSVGRLIIEGSADFQEIPIVLGIEDSNYAFAIIINSIPKYDFVYPGGKLGLELRVFDLVNSNEEVVRSNYFVKNFDGETILNGNTDLVVGSGSKTELIDVPREWKEGDYVFIIEIDYKETKSFASLVFSVSNKEKDFFLDDSRVLLVSIIIFVVFILILVLYFVKTRDSLLIELQKQQGNELKRNLEYIENSKKKIEKSFKNPEKKKEELGKIKKIRNKVVMKLKKKHDKQRKEIKDSKEKKVVKEEIKKKVLDWKKKSVGLEAKKEMKSSVKGVKSQIKAWNERGLKGK